jgi:hypothetical protein
LGAAKIPLVAMSRRDQWNFFSVRRNAEKSNGMLLQLKDGATTYNAHITKSFD